MSPPARAVLLRLRPRGVRGFRVQAGRNCERRSAVEWGVTDDLPPERYVGLVAFGWMLHVFVPGRVR